MTNCCAPNPVNLVNNCYLWCQLPPSQLYVDSDGLLTSDFDDCLRANGLNIDETPISGYHYFNGAGMVAPTIKGVWVWALFVVGALGCVF